ncbi:hypothetical protein [Rhizocola hellebori]|uniref:hypothetical protein n=1 Tax=Rhizocola hellebori TaxID=1392758 RepID=UPI0019427606|nr:hypothetical protein [Rhizocola hellebori]
MGQSDDEVGVDLYMLWVAGSIHLPRTAEVCEDNNQDVHNTAFWEGTAFRNEWGQESDVAAPWRALRDSVQRVFSTSAINTDLAGHALVAIAQNYANNDAEAAETMNSLIADYRASDELPQPPGPLELENPGDPVQTTTGPDGTEVPVRDDDE